MEETATTPAMSNKRRKAHINCTNCGEYFASTIGVKDEDEDAARCAKCQTPPNFVALASRLREIAKVIKKQQKERKSAAFERFLRCNENISGV